MPLQHVVIDASNCYITCEHVDKSPRSRFVEYNDTLVMSSTLFESDP